MHNANSKDIALSIYLFNQTHNLYNNQLGFIVERRSYKIN